ncbi:MAG: hypothetical protein ABN488_03650, partial [Methylobacteriaceae bacterium]
MTGSHPGEPDDEVFTRARRNRRPGRPGFRWIEAETDPQARAVLRENTFNASEVQTSLHSRRLRPRRRTWPAAN